MLHKISNDNELTQWAIRQRRHLHMHPELSGEEYETAAYVKARLTEMGITLLEHYPAPNVVGYIKGTEGKRTLAIRADMDALPIQESGDKPYISQVPGVMHACGHDGHTATLLGAVKWLSAHPDQVKNNIIVIFQSSEEVSPGGAWQLVKAGIMNGVDAIYGMHYMPDMPLGRLGFAREFAMASSDDFDIIIEGKGGHGGIPHEAIDPIYISSHLIQAFQSIVSRSLNPLKSGVISIGVIQAGNAYNVIPETVQLKGTIRALTYQGAQLMHQRTEQLTQSICASFNAKGHYHFIAGTPPLYNHPQYCDRVQQIIEQTFGSQAFFNVEPEFGAEDFAFYLKEQPGAYINVGIQGAISQYPLHHPRYDLDESAIPDGIELMVQLALNG